MMIREWYRTQKKVFGIAADIYLLYALDAEWYRKAKKGVMTVYYPGITPQPLARIVFLLIRNNKLLVLNPRYFRLNCSLIPATGK
jgi:hypothetical protein